MKQHRIVQITLAPALLFAATADAPNGSIHLSVQREIAEGEDVGAIDAGDARVTNAALCNQARELFDAIAKYYADENAIPVVNRADRAAPLVQPTRR